MKSSDDLHARFGTRRPHHQVPGDSHRHARLHRDPEIGVLRVLQDSLEIQFPVGLQTKRARSSEAEAQRASQPGRIDEVAVEELQVVLEVVVQVLDDVEALLEVVERFVDDGLGVQFVAVALVAQISELHAEQLDGQVDVQIFVDLVAIQLNVLREFVQVSLLHLAPRPHDPLVPFLRVLAELASRVRVCLQVLKVLLPDLALRPEVLLDQSVQVLHARVPLEEVEIPAEQLYAHVQVRGARHEAVLTVNHVVLESRANTERVDLVGQLVVEGEFAKVLGELASRFDLSKVSLGVEFAGIGGGSQISQMTLNERSNLIHRLFVQYLFQLIGNVRARASDQ